jgi:hypothetical protein
MGNLKLEVEWDIGDWGTSRGWRDGSFLSLKWSYLGRGRLGMQVWGRGR